MQVELWWLHLGFVAGDAAQTYAATQSAADSQRRLQTWLALATPAWPARAMLLLAQVCAVLGLLDCVTQRCSAMLLHLLLPCIHLTAYVAGTSGFQMSSPCLTLASLDGDLSGMLSC